MALGDRIKELRKAAGLTQRALADRTEVDYTYLSKIENDKLEHTPSIRTIQAIAAALGADELELMELANKLPPALGVFTRSAEARRFLTRAAAAPRSSDDWRELTRVLDEREAAASARERSR